MVGSLWQLQEVVIAVFFLSRDYKAVDVYWILQHFKLSNDRGSPKTIQQYVQGLSSSAPVGEQFWIPPQPQIKQKSFYTKKKADAYLQDYLMRKHGFTNWRSAQDRIDDILKLVSESGSGSLAILKENESLYRKYTRENQDYTHQPEQQNAGPYDMVEVMASLGEPTGSIPAIASEHGQFSCQGSGYGSEGTQQGGYTSAYSPESHHPSRYDSGLQQSNIGDKSARTCYPVSYTPGSMYRSTEPQYSTSQIMQPQHSTIQTSGAYNVEAQRYQYQTAAPESRQYRTNTGFSAGQNEMSGGYEDPAPSERRKRRHHTPPVSYQAADQPSPVGPDGSTPTIADPNQTFEPWDPLNISWAPKSWSTRDYQDFIQHYMAGRLLTTELCARFEHYGKIAATRLWAHMKEHCHRWEIDVIEEARSGVQQAMKDQKKQEEKEEKRKVREEERRAKEAKRP